MGRDQRIKPRDTSGGQAHTGLTTIRLTRHLTEAAEQTTSLPDLKRQEKKASRVGFYLEHLQRTALKIPKEVKYGLFDGLYAKLKFVNGVLALGFEVISKLRCDADLKYL